MTSSPWKCTVLPTERRLASRFWWVSTTPLGSPVLPEVYWMKETSSRETAGGTARIASAASSAAGGRDSAQRGGGGVGGGGEETVAGPRRQGGARQRAHLRRGDEHAH